MIGLPSAGVAGWPLRLGWRVFSSYCLSPYFRIDPAECAIRQPGLGRQHGGPVPFPKLVLVGHG
jgi:hypothetical protein